MDLTHQIVLLENKIESVIKHVERLRRENSTLREDLAKREIVIQQMLNTSVKNPILLADVISSTFPNS